MNNAVMQITGSSEHQQPDKRRAQAIGTILYSQLQGGENSL
jgi:hypothetical protein